MLRYLLGYGWWTVWHLFLLSFLLPLAALFGWLLKVVPGAGPQGGEAAFLLLVWLFLGLSLTSLVNALLLASTRTDPAGRARYGRAVLVWAVVCPAAVLVIWNLTDAASRVSPGSTTRTLWMLGLTFVFGAVYWFNLSALARFHARRAD
jgi:hypothetical protein